MSSVRIMIHGAEKLGEVFDIAEEEVQKARTEGIQVELSQERGIADAAILFTVAAIVEPFVKEFLNKFLGRIASNLADRLTKSDEVESFVIVVNDIRYTLPEDLERMRQDQGLR